MKKLARFSTFFFLWLCIGSAAFADDLDIYLGTGETAVTYKPNVMFIMDTSGSMNNKDGTEKSRMMRVKEALSSAIGSATDINAGLMRFSDFGGPVLYPIEDLDAPVNPELIVSVGSKDGDAHEIDEDVYLNNSVLELSRGKQKVISGVSFADLNIPQGATITSAHIRLTSAQQNSAPTKIIIRGEEKDKDDDDDDKKSSRFKDDEEDLSDRDTTDSEVIWDSNNEFPLDGEVVVTPDISIIIQEIVDDKHWCGGERLNILFEGTSQDVASARKTHAYDSGTDQAAQLVVTYDQTTANGCIAAESYYQINNQNDNREETKKGNGSTGNRLDFDKKQNEFVGLRFTNVSIPQDAEIQKAYLSLYSAENYNLPATMHVHSIKEDDVGAFGDSQKDVLDDKKKGKKVDWVMLPSKKNDKLVSPDISDLVEEIVGRDGWKSGNDLGFLLHAFKGKAGAYTYKGSKGYAPKLYIQFKGNAVPGQVSTVRDHLLSKIDELGANGYTPIVDTLYEATQYYGGRPVDYGLQRGTSATSQNVRRSTRVSHRKSYIGSDSIKPSGCDGTNLSDSKCMTETIPSGATYVSPVTDLQCQTNNHIVLLSDGDANYNHSVSKIEALIGKSCTGSGGEQCGLDLVRNLYDKNKSAIDRRVMTHTIGFSANTSANNFLNKLALQGGGNFYKADDSSELLDAFDTILRTVKDVNTTFVSPGIAVNQLNRLTHQDELYFALFKPDEGAQWPGNLKKYRLDGKTIVDKNGANAVDSVSGFFTDTAHSYWSVLTDGNDVREGGVISLFDSNRNMYFFDGPGSIIKSNNRISETNLNISTGDLGLGLLDIPLRDAVLKWARGVDVNDADGDGDVTDVRLQMGDPIHSQPSVVSYSATDSAIFVATNQGFLHSFDAKTGEENFAIAPKELLVNLPTFYENNSTFNHVYGIDGEIVWREVEGKQYLYVGMRRGGRNYYVFDVTSKTSPKLVFSIKGGETDLEKLGQTWSRPTLTKMKFGSTVKNVMIVGGGYDEQADTNPERLPNTVGNAVFIFDADSGALLWSASNADADLNVSAMEYSIPGRISVIDRDRDGLADHMYAADIGGQIFRFDIYNGESGADLIKGARLADLGGAGVANNRHFYYGPDVSEVALDDEIYYAVAVGSGWRAAPLDTAVNDKFYMIKDKGVFSVDEDGEYSFGSDLTQDDLFDVTPHTLASTDDGTRALAASTFAGKQGWSMDMVVQGEKVLASPLIIDYKILFTSYIPASSSQSACAPPTGRSRAYLVNLVNGNAVGDLNNNSELDHQDRYSDLNQSGIAPQAKILIEDITAPVVCLGTECSSAVIETNDDGTDKECSSAFSCLMENIYGRFERVMHESWKSEIERD